MNFVAKCLMFNIRGGDTRLEAKDTKKKLRPRTGMLETKNTNTSVLQKKGLQNFFSGNLHKKRSTKNFSADLQNFNHSKNSAVLEPRTGQFLRT